MTATIRQARTADTHLVSSILLEAAGWLTDQGMTMWQDNELLPERIAADVESGDFYLAMRGAEAAGTMKFQLEDPLFWPDVPEGEAAYVHRLAVRRRFAGSGLSTQLLQWAKERAMSLGRRFLRLDCAAARPQLRAFYERFEFQHHSDRQVGPYFVSRYQIDLSRANG